MDTAVPSVAQPRPLLQNRLMLAVSLPLDSGYGVLLVIFAVVLIAPRVGRLLQLPDLVGLIIGGIIVGPHTLGLIERAGTVEALGTAGLLYLMFQAGLELDADDFAAHRTRAAVFGVFTFALPFTIGVIAHMALGFDLFAALLLGSCWASRTLLAYPMFQQSRAVSNRAVSIGVAGTVVTDTAALLVLGVLARAHEGELTAQSIMVQIPLMVAAGWLVLVALPRLAGWFFSGIGRDRSARFLFVMVALYGCALLAEAVGVEPIIGAFFAGLAMNRQVVEGSELDDRIRQFGSTLLVPIFLVSVGMLIDPATAFTNGRVLLLAVTFTLVVVVGKTLAAAITGRIYRLDTAERATLIALSVPQAAATLAAVFVGFEIGILEQETVDAVVLVILVTCLLGTVAARYAIDNLPPAPNRATPLGRRIIVPISPARLDEPIIELAAAFGRRDSGTVYPLSVLDLGSSNAEVTALHGRLVANTEQIALANGCEAQSIVRLDLTPAAGLVHAAIETNASLILLPWDGRRTGSHDRFSHTADTLLDLATTPVIIARVERLKQYCKIVLLLDAEDLRPEKRAIAELVWLVGARLSDHLKIPLVLATAADHQTLAGVPGITSHVSATEAERTGPYLSDELVICPVGRGGDEPSTLWVAIPRPAPDIFPAAASSAGT